MSSRLIAFRADASVDIGTGHVMRCLTLADHLRDRGYDCLFLCRPQEGHLVIQIEERGHGVVLLSPPRKSVILSANCPPHAVWLGTDWEADAAETRRALANVDVDWLVVDHYALDSRWERALRSKCRRMMVLDDLADRPHECDLLLDPTLGRNDADYRDLIPTDAVALLGPQYALLRPEFASYRAESLARRESPKFQRLLITLGGADKHNVTGSMLEALDTSPLPAELRITVVMGPTAPWLDQVRDRAAKMRNKTDVQVGVREMAQLMTGCDLAIGAAGGTSWERCCLGLPAFVICLADNQFEMAMSFQVAEAAVAMGSVGETVQHLTDLGSQGTMEAFLIHTSKAAARITDGQGTERVYRRMIS